MVKFKEFYDDIINNIYTSAVDKLNIFLKEQQIKIVDVKYQVVVNGIGDVRAFILLQYED